MAQNVKVNVQFDIIENINKNVAEMNKRMSKLGRQKLPSLSNAFTKMSIGITGINQGIQLMSRAVRGVTGFFGKFINEARKVEDLTTRLKVLTGSLSTAQGLMKDLTEFAARTPFQLEGIADTANLLLSFGFQTDEIVGKLQQLGDVAAGSGSSLKEVGLIFGQVSAAGKLTGERLLQLQERGIPILDALADEMGVLKSSVRDLVSRGAVDFETFSNAFGSLSEKGGKFFEGMIEQSKTLSGVFSTLSDNVSLLLAGIGEKFLPVIKKVSIAIIKFIQKNREEIIRLTQEGILGLLKGLKVTFKFIEDFKNAISGKSVAEVMEISRLDYEVKKLQGTLKDLEAERKDSILDGKSVLDIMRKMRGVQDEIDTLNNKMLEINAGDKGVFGKMSDEIDLVIKQFQKVGKEIKKVKEEVKATGQAAKKNLLKELFGVQGKGDKQQLGAFKFLQGGAGGATAAVSAVAARVNPVLGQAIEFFGRSQEEFRKMMEGFMEQLANLPEQIADNVPFFIEKLVEGIPLIVERFNQAVPKLIDNLQKLLSRPEFWNAVVNSLIAQLASPVFWTRIAVSAQLAFIQAIPGIAKALVDEIKNIGGVFGGGGGAGGIVKRVGGFLGFQEGGEVPAVVHKGENVIDRSTNDKLKDFLNNQTGSTANINLIIGEQQLANVLVDINQKGLRTA